MAVMGMVLILGLAVLAACALMPRGIGQEDEPLSRVRLRLPDVEGLALRMNRPHRSASRPVATRPSIVPPPPNDGPSAMGAPQPVLTQDPAGLIPIPGQ